MGMSEFLQSCNGHHEADSTEQSNYFANTLPEIGLLQQFWNDRHSRNVNETAGREGEDPRDCLRV